MRINDAVADSIARSMDSSSKMVQFFREYDQENKKKQELVENQLTNVLYMIEEIESEGRTEDKINIEDLQNLGYRTMIDALRAVKRARNKRIRDKLQWVIIIFERYKQIKAYKTLQGIKNLLLLFKTLYVYLVDQHIVYTGLIEDEITLRTRELSTQTTMMFDDAMRDLIDSEQSVDMTKGMIKKMKDHKGKNSTYADFFND